MVLSSAIAPIGQSMTFITTIFRVGSVTTTLATKTWSSRFMYILIYNEAFDVRAYHHSPHIMPIFSNEGVHDVFDVVMCGCLLTFEWTTC